MTYDKKIPEFLLANGWKRLDRIFGEEKEKEMDVPWPVHCSWCEETRKKNKGASFDTYQKGNIWIQIEEHWDKLYSSSKPYKLVINDMSKAGYSTQGFVGWMGENRLMGLNKKPSLEYFKLSLKHLEV